MLFPIQLILLRRNLNQNAVYLPENGCKVLNFHQNRTLYNSNNSPN